MRGRGTEEGKRILCKPDSEFRERKCLKIIVMPAVGENDLTVPGEKREEARKENFRRGSR